MKYISYNKALDRYFLYISKYSDQIAKYQNMETGNSGSNISRSRAIVNLVSYIENGEDKLVIIEPMCGTGNIARHINNQSEYVYKGYDINPFAIERAKAHNFGDLETQFCTGDILEPIDNIIEVPINSVCILSFHALNYFPPDLQLKIISNICSNEKIRYLIFDVANIPLTKKKLLIYIKNSTIFTSLPSLNIELNNHIEGELGISSTNYCIGLNGAHRYYSTLWNTNNDLLESTLTSYNYYLNIKTETFDSNLYLFERKV